ncbi:MAG: GldG family protein, partial [Oscillospiraceae bacterium]|nr:GldG family protein [Oscillospiraceae bacterium]
MDNEKLIINNEQLDEMQNDAKQEKRVSIFNSRKLRHGGYSIAITVIFIAAAVLLNVIVNTLLSRFDFRLDLTESKLYSIERSTADYLAGIDQIVNIYFCSTEEVFSARGMQYNQVIETARRFSEANSNINIHFIDRLSNPAFAVKYGGNLTDTSIVIESETTERYKVIGERDYYIFEFFFNGDPITEQMADEAFMFGVGDMVSWSVSAGTEQAFLSAIVTVTNLSPVRVAFTAGSDNSYMFIADTLERNGYLTETTDLFTTAEISPETDFLIIYAPTFDLSADDCEKIEAWLDNDARYGKTLMYFPHFEMPETPNIDALLERWGMVPERAYVVQFNPSYAFSNEFMQFGFSHMQPVMAVGPFSSGVDGVPLVGTVLRPVRLLFEERANYITQPLLVGFEGTASYPVDLSEEEREQWHPVLETLNVAAMSLKYRYEGLDELTSRVLVFGSQAFFDGSRLTAEQFSNAQYLLGMLSEL